MKNILITGVNSYVGNNLADWLNKEPDKYKIEKISLRNEKWKQHDFSSYDIVVHVAGIAHMKETKKNRHLYFKINRDLTFEVAEKAKKDGVSQFIFLSSMSVYGLNTGVIDEYTLPNPKNSYGRSKLEAEQLIQTLEDEKFRVVILRPPMIYGKGCKGNYQRLAKLARISPVFPSIKNQRSMIYIDNLSEFIKMIIEKMANGVFFPQNKSYVQTSELVQLIAKFNGKSIKLIKIFNPILRIVNNKTIEKVFGDLLYSESLLEKQKHIINYANFIELEESIRKTEE